jgi:hypothetical protein
MAGRLNSFGECPNQLLKTRAVAESLCDSTTARDSPILEVPYYPMQSSISGCPGGKVISTKVTLL